MVLNSGSQRGPCGLLEVRGDFPGYVKVYGRGSPRVHGAYDRRSRAGKLFDAGGIFSLTDRGCVIALGEVREASIPSTQNESGGREISGN